MIQGTDQTIKKLKHNLPNTNILHIKKKSEIEVNSGLYAGMNSQCMEKKISTAI